MEIERILVRLVADATQYNRVINDSQTRLLHFSADITSALSRNAIQLAMDYERAAISFEVMTRSASVSKKLLTDIRNLAVESPFQTSELITSAKQVLAFGFEVNDVIPVLSRLGDVSSATGVDMDRLILAFGQVRTTGRLMGQELRQFTNAGVPILTYLSKVMGVTEAQIPNLVRQGRIGFSDVARAFNMMTNEGGLFYGMMDRINKETLYGRWQNLKETFQILGTDLGLAAFDGLHLKDVMTDIADSVRNLDKGQAVGFFNGVRLTFMGISQGAREFINVLVKVYEWVERQGRAAATWFAENQRVLRTIIAVTLSVAALGVAVRALSVVFFSLSIILRVVNGLLLVFRAILGLTTLFTSFMAFGTAIVAIFNPVTLTVLGLVAAITGLVVALDELGAFEGFGQEFARGWSNLASEFTTAWSTIVDAIKSGDMKGAFEILMAGIRLAWKTLLTSLEAEIERFAFNMEHRVSAEMDVAWLNIAKQRQRLNLFDSAETTQQKMAAYDEQIAQRYRQRDLDIRIGSPALNNRIAGMWADLEKENVRFRDKVMETRVRQMIPAGTAANIHESVTRPLEEAQRIGNVGRIDELLGDYFKRSDISSLPEGAKPEGIQALGGIPGGLSVHTKMAAEYRRAWESVEMQVRNVRTLTQEGKAGTPEMKAAVENLNTLVKGLDTLSDGFMGVTDATRKVVNEIAIWPQVSADVLAAVKELNKEMHEGVTPLDRFQHQMSLLNEAVHGPLPGLNAVIGAWSTVTQPPGVGTKLNPLIDMPEYDYGIYKRYEELRKTVGKPWEERTPAMMQGSREAQETIDRSNAQALSVQEQVLQTAREANTIQREAQVYRRQVVDALKAMQKGEAGFGWGMNFFGGKN